MRNTWKILIIAVLVAAVAVILAGKHNRATTASPASSPASQATAAGPPAAAPQTPAPAAARPVTDPSPQRTAATPAESVATPKPTPMAKPKALPKVIELGSETCTPCQMMQPILEELRKEYKGQLEVPFWDVYKFPAKTKEYRIRVIPTQVFLDANGKEFFRHEGFFPKEDILKTFQEHGIVLRRAR